MKQAPAWFRTVGTYTSWPQMANAHGPFGKDRLTDRERKALRRVPLFINVQTRNAIREAHQLGGRALSYISLMDTYVHTAGFENGTARVPWDPCKPQILLIDDRGCFVNTPMDCTRRMWRYLVCNNTREYVNAALQMAREQMEKGADGLFIDNSSRRRPCYGHGLPVGYSQTYHSVLAAIPQWMNPELVARKSPEELYCLGELPGFRREFKAIQALPRHRHIYPNRSHDYAYERLLEKVRKLVHSYGRDKVVVLNVNGPEFNNHTDGVMLESYIFSWAWKGANMDWKSLKRLAAKWDPYTRGGGRVFALSYFGNTNRAVIEDVLFSFAAASLSGFLWSDYGTCKEAATVRTMKLGRRLTELAGQKAVDYSFFDHSLVAINGGQRLQVVELPAPREFRYSSLTDIRDGKRIHRTDGVFRLTIPAHSGRVYAVTER